MKKSIEGGILFVEDFSRIETELIGPVLLMRAYGRLMSAQVCIQGCGRIR